ncbi:MAG: hypothetical protein OHK0017_03340 [Patescibacteria group bacterium]
MKNLLLKNRLNLFFALFFIFVCGLSYFSWSKVESNPLFKSSSTTYSIAQAKNTGKVNRIEINNIINLSQEVNFQTLFEAPKLGKITQTDSEKNWEEKRIKNGDIFIVAKDKGQSDYRFIFSFRLLQILILFLFFAGLVIWFTKTRGLKAIASMLFSGLIIIGIFVPLFFLGIDAIFLSLICGIMIMVSSFYFAHGASLVINVAFTSSVITLFLSVLISVVSVQALRLTGSASEDSNYLVSVIDGVDLKGLLYSSILISTVGVLDDITTAQTKIIVELKKLKPEITFQQLVRISLSVGEEHVISLVNTLFMAYAGVALPTLILFSVSKVGPWWVFLNSEVVAEEVVRTVCGSLALIIAVPITCYLSAWIVTRKRNTQKFFQVEL